MTFIGSCWNALSRVDDEFIEFGRMPPADEFWNAEPNERGIIDTPAKNVGVWLIGWWIPVIMAFLITGYLIGWNWIGLW